MLQYENSSFMLHLISMFLFLLVAFSLFFSRIKALMFEENPHKGVVVRVRMDSMTTFEKVTIVLNTFIVIVSAIIIFVSYKYFKSILYVHRNTVTYLRNKLYIFGQMKHNLN